MSVNNLQWSPHQKNVFAVGQDNIFLFNLDQQVVFNGKPQLVPFLTHQGHKNQCIDFDWNPQLEWCLISGSDNSNLETQGGGGGGQVQIWAPLDLLRISEKEALKKLQGSQKF